jgi:hypothetical protein
LNRVIQVLVVVGAFGVVGIVGLGALSRQTLVDARKPKPTPVPLVGLPSPGPEGWVVTNHDAVLSMVRGPVAQSGSVAGKGTVARITVCRNAYGVTADGSLTNGLKTDAATIAFALMRRADLGTVLTPQEATFAGLSGYFLDVAITDPSQFSSQTDLWLVRADQANCAVVLDTSDAESNVDPAVQVGVPAIVRLGLFSEPDGTNVMVLIASEGIGARSKPDMTDVDEAAGIVDTFSLNTPAPTATPSPRP